MAGDKSTKRETCQGQSGCLVLCNDALQIGQLSTTFVVGASTGANTPEVLSDGSPAILNKRFGQRLNHLVLHRAAKKGVRMRDDGDAFDGHLIWLIAQPFQGASRPIENHRLGC